MSGAGSRTLKLSILADASNLATNLKKAETDTETFGSKVGDIGKKVGVAMAAATAAAGAFAIKFGVDAVKAASDLSETLSKTNVLFGASAKQVEAFANTAASKFGQSKQQALDAAATFATFGKSAGLAGDDLVKFSTDFVGLASDLASFNNTSPEQAIQAIGAALRGESEPLRAYGVLLDDASMRQKALELGIISTTKEALTPQQKVLAAQALIYQQTAAAQGDFSRTSEGLANQQRILEATLNNVKTTIGTALLPVALELFSIIGEKVVPAISSFADRLATALGPAAQNIIAALRDFLLPVLRGLWGFISETLIPGLVKTFAPILRGIANVFGDVTAAIVNNREKFEPLLQLFRAVADFVSKYLAPAIGTVLGGAFTVLGKIMGGVVSTLAFVVDKIAAGIRAAVNLAMDAINALIRAWNSLPDWLRPGGQVSELSWGSSSGSSNTLDASRYTAQIPTSTSTTSKTTSSSTFTVPTLTGSTSTSTSGSGSGSTSSSSTTTTDPALMDALRTTLNVATSTLKIATDAMSRDIQQINVEIQGLLVDPEGTARAIEDVLYQSVTRNGTPYAVAV